jgi:hypothetical protein
MQIVAEQEKVMKLTTSWMEHGIEQGLEQGLEQERRSAISSLMELRYGSIDTQLLSIFPALMALNSSEYTPLLLQLSKEELLERFNSTQK